MSRKNKIIVSIVGISIISLALIGLTYGYYLTRIQGNTNNKSISISTANLELTYSDNSDVITGTNIVPGTTLSTKTFTVTNSGDNNVDSYSVGLVNVINTFTRLDDIKYTVTCSSSVTGKTCNGVSESTFPNENSYIIENQINKDEVQTYVIKVEYKEMNVDQSIDMGKTLEAKIDIFDTKSLTIKGTVTNYSENDYVVIHSKEQTSEIVDGKYKFIGIEPDTHKITIKNRKTTTTKQTTLNVSKGEPAASGSNITYNDEKNVADADIKITGSTVTIDVTKISDGKILLKDAIIDSAQKGGENRTTLGSTVTEFTSISGENERVLNSAPDDYGTSYYYRGNVIDNYVSFAGKIWRIVRINGDGTVRLVLDDVAKDSSGNVINTAFNSSSNGNAYVGYMYGTAGSTTYDATHENKNESTIKIAVDKWYEDNLKTNYSNYLADTLFCNDKTLAENGIGGVTTQLGYGTNKTYYSSTERLRYSTGETEITTATPTLKCAEKANDNYSRFTTTKTMLPSGKETNGNLKYPIGLLTADEVSFAGAYKYGQTNKTYYLYNSSITSYWWLSSPSFYYAPLASEWGVSYSSGSLSYNPVSYSSTFRPSINLKADILVGGGDGTKENLYIIS